MATQKENELIELGYEPGLARIVCRTIADLEKIEGFRLVSARPWSSNLPEVMPSIGTKIEGEITKYIEGQEIMLMDQRRRKLVDQMNQIEDDGGNPYFATEWVEKNIIGK